MMQEKILHRLEKERIKKLQPTKMQTALPWQKWLQTNFPSICSSPLADRHIRLWEWVERLTLGERAKSFIAIWPRGGAKSTTVELACARLCIKRSRRFVLYVCETQDQANKHVQAIASLLEKLGIERALNVYGSSKGWRRQELRTANGFNVAAFGLDTGSRGVKIDEFRPDLIVMDDIDGLHDTQKTTQKKQEIITNTVLPAGSPDMAVLFVQNRIRQNSIMSLLADGLADFLRNREPISEEPAVRGLKVDSVPHEDGSNRYKIIAGEATWEGQNLQVCEQQINDFGLKAFRREAQHEVSGADGIFFRVSQLKTIDPEDVPPITIAGLAGDLAATEGGGDWTVSWFMGKAANNTYYVFAVIRAQLSSERVREMFDLATEHYLPKYPRRRFHLPQDPAQAGKDQAQQLGKRYKKWDPVIETVSGDKATRATNFQEAINVGNVFLVKENLPEIFEPYVESLLWQYWHRRLIGEYRDFKEKEEEQVDDQVDAGSDCFNELNSAPEVHELQVA
jgi:predicted phage terminase large subunit-like protein